MVYYGYLAMTTIGSLLLELQLDSKTFDRQMEDIKRSIQVQGRNLDRRLLVKPIVDHKPLTELNKHLDKKGDHVVRLNRQFKRDPIKPTVDLSDLDKLEKRIANLNKVQAKVTIANNSKSKPIEQIQKIQLDVDSSQLQKSLEKSTEKLGETVSKSVEKGVKKSSGKKEGLFAGVTKAVTAIPKTVARGFYEGIGLTYSEQLTKGFIKGIEGKFNKSLERIGEQTSKKIINKAENVGDRLVQKMGLGNSVKNAADKAFNAISEIIPTDELENRLGSVEQAVGKLVDGLLELQSTSKQLKNLKDIGASLQGVASIPLEGIDRRRSRKLDELTLQVRKRADEMKPDLPDLPSNAESINIVSGGFAGTKGASSERVAERVKMMLGDNAQVDYVANPDTDTSVNINKTPKWLAQILGRFGKHNVLQGYNKDAIEASAKALAYYEKSGEKLPINFLGYSGGGYVAKESTEILSKMGIQSKGVGFGTPLFGATGKTDPNQFRAYLGEGDPLGKLRALLSGQQQYLSGSGEAHKLSNYLGGQDFQKELEKFLGVKTTGVQKGTFELEGFEGDLNTLATDLAQVLGDSSQAMFAQKTGLYKTYLAQIKQHRSKLAQLFGDAHGDLLDQIEQYDQALVDAEQIVKQVFGVQEPIAPALQRATEPTQTATNPPPVQEQPKTSTKTQQNSEAKQKINKELQEAQKEFIRIYSKFIQDTTKTLGIQFNATRLPQVKEAKISSAGGYAGQTNQILLPEGKLKAIVSSMDKPIQGMSKYEFDEINKKLSTIAHEGYHAMQSGFSGLSTTDIATQQRDYTNVRLQANEEQIKQFQRLKRGSIDTLAGRSTESASKHKGFHQLDAETKKKALEHVQIIEQQAYTFQAKFMAAFANQAKKGAKTIAEAFENAINDVIAETQQTVEQTKAEIEASAKAVTASVKVSQSAVAIEEIKPAIEAVQQVVNQVQPEPPKVEMVKPEKDPMQEARDALNKYNVEIIKEFARLSGRSTRSKKGDMIEDLLKNVKPVELDKVIESVKPFITTGTKGGQKLQKAPYTDLEKQAVTKIKEFDKEINLRLKKIQDLKGKEYEQALGNVLDDINKQIAKLDKLTKARLSPEMRLEVGRAKGRMEAGYRNFSSQLRAKQGQQANLMAQGQTQQQAEQAIQQKAEQQSSNPFDAGNLDLFEVSLARVNRELTKTLARRAQKTYEAILKSVAQASNVQMKPADMPKVVVDNDRLQQLGAKALYDIKRNQIIINDEIAKILQSGSDALENYSEELKDVVHEARHAMQFDFGKSSIAKMSVGVAQPGTELINPQNVPRSARYNAARSVQVANSQAGGLLPKSFLQTIYRTEADAYGFEQFTPKILQNAQAQLKQKQSPMQRVGEFIKGFQDNPQLGQLNTASKFVEDLISNAGLGADTIEKLATGFTDFAASMVENIPVVGQIFAPLLQDSGALLKILKPLAVAFIGFKVIETIVRPMSQFAMASLDAALQMDRMTRIMTFLKGTSEAARDSIAGIRNEAKALGIDLRQAVEGQVKLDSATKGTTMEGFTSESLGQAARQAASVYGSDVQQQERMFLALSQMAGKGKIQMEELRGQLSEAGIPNAMQIMARSIGVTTQQLDAMAMRGEIISEEVLPKFAMQLAAETAGGVTGASNSAQASLNRFNNSLFELQANFGEGLIPIQKTGLDVLTKMLEVAAQNTMALIVAISILAGQALKALFSGLAGVIANFIKVRVGVTTAAGAFRFLARQVGVFLAQVALMTAAIGLFQAIGDRFSNLGGYLQKFADDADSAFKRYQKGIDEINNKEIKNPTRNLNDTGNSFFGSLVPQNMPGGEAVTGLATRIERGAQRGALGMNPVLQGGANLVNRIFGTEFRPGATYGELEAQGQQAARTQLIDRSFGSIQSVKDILQGVTTNAQGLSQTDTTLQQMKGIDTNLRDAQSRRRALLPGDTAGREAIDKEIEGLQRQRQELTPILANTQAYNASIIETLKSAREAALQEGDMSTYEQLTGLLNQATEQQNKLNTALQGSIDPIGRLTRAFADIQGVLNSTLRSIEQTTNAGKRSIAALQLAGASSGDLEMARSNLDIQNMEQQASARQTAIASAEDILMNDSDIKNFSQAIADRLGVDSLLELDPTQVQAQVSILTDSTDRDVVNKFNEEYEKLLTLRSEADNLTTQVAETRAQTVQRLRDLARNVYDMFRGIEEQSNQLAITTQQIQAQAQMQQAQARFKDALIGFQDSFINDFVNELVGFVEALNRPLDASIQAQQQALQAQQQFSQQLRQIYDLSQQVPSQLQGMQTSTGETIAQTPNNGSIGSTDNVTSFMGSEVANPQPITPEGGVVANQTMGFSPLALVDLADIQRQVLAQTQGQLNTTPEGLPQIPGLSIGSPNAGVTPEGLPALSVPIDSPEAITQQQDALRGLDAIGSVNAANNGLQQAAKQAADNYGQQLDNIETQLGAAQATAESDLRASVDRMSRALWQAGRNMSEAGRNFTRSLEDLQNQNFSRSGFGQLQGTLTGLDRQLEDSVRNMNDYARGLQQTIDQAGQSRSEILNQIASGMIPESQLPAMRQVLVELDATAAQASNQLVQVQREIGDFQQAVSDAQAEQIRLFQRQRQREFAGAQAQSLRDQGFGSEALDLEFIQRRREIIETYQDEAIELNRLYEAGQLTTDQYSSMRSQLDQLLELRLTGENAKRIKEIGDRAFRTAQTIAQMNTELTRARQQNATVNNDPTQALQLDAFARGQEQANTYASKLKELQDLRYEGILNDEQFQSMSASLEEFNNISLANIRRELEQTAATNLVDTLLGGSSFDAGEVQKKVNEIITTARSAMRAGLISEGEYEQVRETGRDIGRVTRSGSQASQLRRMDEFNNDPLFRAMAQSSGLGGVLALSDLSPGMLNAGSNVDAGFNAGMDAQSPAIQAIDMQTAVLNNTLNKILQALVGRSKGNGTMNNQYNDMASLEMATANI